MTVRNLLTLTTLLTFVSTVTAYKSAKAVSSKCKRNCFKEKYPKNNPYKHNMETISTTPHLGLHHHHKLKYEPGIAKQEKLQHKIS